MSYEGGTQAARTALAWSRTSVALWGNGVLLLVRRPPSLHARFDLVLAVLEFALAVMVGLMARHRAQVLRRHPLPHPVAARRHLLTLGWTVAGVCVVTGIGFAL